MHSSATKPKRHAALDGDARVASRHGGVSYLRVHGTYYREDLIRLPITSATRQEKKKAAKALGILGKNFAE